MPKGVYLRPSGMTGENKLKRLERKAYIIFNHQKATVGATYSLFDFIRWYVREHKKKKLKRPEVGRRDHNKLYSFDNVDLIEKTENIQERNTRLGNPCNRHRPVIAFYGDGKIKEFLSKTEAANYFGVNVKTVWNHCHGRTKLFFKYGHTLPHALRFEWK